MEARNIIIATGSEAKSLPGYTVDEKQIITNIGALDMAAVPQSLVVVGAGAVGVEFASLYNDFRHKGDVAGGLASARSSGRRGNCERASPRFHA